MIEVENATREDLPQIAKWYAHEWAKPDAEERILQSLERRLDSKEIYAIKAVRLENNLAGVACLQRQDMGDAHPELSPWLAGVYVVPEFRHKGIGFLLSRAIVNEAGAQNYDECYLFTDKMEHWYREQGWETIGLESYKGMRVAVMKLKLHR